MQAIWEPEFKAFSFGFRPGKSAHDALYWLAQVIRRRRTQWVVEADIRGFFDQLSHAHLLGFLERRIKDPNCLRLIRRFLKAGVMEDGAVQASTEGAPQGGLYAGNKVANSRIKWGLRIARACLASGQVGCSDVGLSLVIDVAAGGESHA